MRRKYEIFLGNYYTIVVESISHCLHAHATHHHVPIAALSRGIAVRRLVGELQCSTSVMPRWSYGEPPRSVWFAAGLHKSSPLVSCKNKATFYWTFQKIHASCWYFLFLFAFYIYQSPNVFSQFYFYCSATVRADSQFPLSCIV